MESQVLCCKKLLQREKSVAVFLMFLLLPFLSLSGCDSPGFFIMVQKYGSNTDFCQRVFWVVGLSVLFSSQLMTPSWLKRFEVEKANQYCNVVLAVRAVNLGLFWPPVTTEQTALSGEIKIVPAKKWEFLFWHNAFPFWTSHFDPFPLLQPNDKRCTRSRGPASSCFLGAHQKGIPKLGQGFHYSTPKKMVMIHINLEPSVQSSQKSDPSLPDQDLSLTLGPWPHAPWLVPFRGAKMYFINSGKLAYFSGYSEKMPKLISAGRWMCEARLVAPWQSNAGATWDGDLAAKCCSAVGCGTGSWKSIYQPLCCCCRKSCGF